MLKLQNWVIVASVEFTYFWRKITDISIIGKKMLWWNSIWVDPLSKLLLSKTFQGIIQTPFFVCGQNGRSIWRHYGGKLLTSGNIHIFSH